MKRGRKLLPPTAEPVVISGGLRSARVASPGSGSGSTTKPRSSIFDNLTDEPYAERFRAVARAMRRSPWWKQVPARDEPSDASGLKETT